MRNPPAPVAGRLLGRRSLLAAGLAAGLATGRRAPAFAHTPPRRAPALDVPVRQARTVPLFRSPEGFPNGLAGTPEGLWIAEQKPPGAPDPDEKAMLVDWSGRHLRTIVTRSRNTSGIAWDGRHVWMGANRDPQGFFETAPDGRTVSHRQIPLGPSGNGGGCHGALFREGKLWIVANRLRGILRVDVDSWQPEFMIPIDTARWHDIAWDAGTIWMVTGTSNSIPENRPGLARFDAATGRLIETVAFVPGSADPHGLEVRDGSLYVCDAGIGPGFVPTPSPLARFVCRVEFV